MKTNDKSMNTIVKSINSKNQRFRKLSTFYIKVLTTVFLLLTNVFSQNYSLQFDGENDLPSVVDDISIANRISGSPYPVSHIPDTLFVVDDNFLTESEILTIESLQGILAKYRPKIYRIRGEGSSLWLNDLIENHDILVDSTYLSDFEGIINHFANALDGTILCNLSENSTNAAISLSGLINALVVTNENSVSISELGLSQLFDATNSNEYDVYSTHHDQFSNQIISYQHEEKYTHLADYSIFSNAIHFFDPINSELTNTVLSGMNQNSVLMGWGVDEYQTVSMTSSNSIMVHPSDWAINLSTLSNFEVELQQQTHSIEIVTQPGTHTVCFVMSDGDNVQWILNNFATSESWYGNPNRGQINMGWTISPAMAELAPTVLNNLYQNAANIESGKDFFIAGPSGLGYIYPDQYPDILTYSEILNNFMNKADLNIVNIIGNSTNEQILSYYLEMDNIDALFYYDYTNYSANESKISWVNGKPIISGRFNLWEGFESPESLADKINELEKNPYSQEGYSLIPVHAWSMTLDDVILSRNLFNEEIRVVAPNEFVQLINQNLNLPEAQFSAEPTSGDAPLNIQFIDESHSNLPILVWAWDFNSDGIIDSDQQNPFYNFENIGLYSVTLIVTNEMGVDTISVQDYIEVFESEIYTGPVWHVATDGNDETGDGSFSNPFATIQHGINSTNNGDTVLVFPGTYSGIGNRNLNTSTREIIIKSIDGPENTIIDCENEARGLFVPSGTGNGHVIDGFTINNGNGGYGAGIKVNNSACIIQNMIIKNGYSGSTNQGGGIFVSQGGDPIIKNCLIKDNFAYSGGGIALYGNGVNTTIQNCTIVNNTSTSYTGGVFSDNNANTTVINSIIWNNSGTDYYIYSNATGTAIYSNIQGGYVGTGNINSDPQFISANDFHLQSTSPCIDAGHPDTQYNDLDSTRNDMGAFYFPQVYGCTDLSAENFNPNANFDDESCVYHLGPVWYISTDGSDETGTGAEDNPFASIQTGIDASSDGDTILVAVGTYYENINYDGKNIAVFGEDKETTIIDGGQNNRVVTIGSVGLIQNFTIKNGYCGNPCNHELGIEDCAGGGILLNGTAKINNCIITENQTPLAYGWEYGGGAIYIHGGSPEISNSIIKNNSTSWGGAIGIRGASPIIKNSIISNNHSGAAGAAIYILVGNAIIDNCTIVENTGNTATIVSYYSGYETIINNSIIWNPLIYGELEDGPFNISYTNITNGFYGPGNINSDPLFTDSETGDYSLNPNSPCIDAGDPDSPLDLDGTIADMGAIFYDQIENPIPSGCTDQIAQNFDPNVILENGSCEYTEIGDYSLQFDGDNDLVIIPQSNTLNDIGELTWSAWIYPEENVGPKKIIRRIPLGGVLGAVDLGWENGVIGVSVIPNENWNDWRSVNAGPFEPFEWYFVTGRVDEEFIKLFINGELIDSTEANLLPYSPSDWLIGGLIDPQGYNFNGRVDEITFFNRALSSVEINDLMENTFNYSDPSLIAHWNFNAGDGNILFDRSGNHNHGSIIEAEWNENIYGCTEPCMENYNPEANWENGTCGDFIGCPDNGDYSLYFYGGLADCGNSPSVNITEELTVQVSVKPINTGWYPSIIAKQSLVDHGWFLFLSPFNNEEPSTSHIAFSGISTEGEYMGAQGPNLTYPQNHFRTFTATFKNGEQKFYEEEQLINTNNFEGNIRIVGENLSIGSAFYDSPYNGYINEIILWDTAYSEIDIAIGIEERIDGIVGKYLFNAGSGNILYDHSGNGNHCYFSEGAEWYENTFGCTDESSLNYNPNADFDDGSCNYGIELSYGNNLISFPGLPEMDSTAQLLESIEAQGTEVNFIIGQGVGLFKTEEGWSGNLNVVDEYSGYWLNISGNLIWTLPLENGYSNPCMTYNINYGNNLLSYSGIDNNETITALGGQFLANNYGFIISQGMGLFNTAGQWTGNLSNLNKETGYWLNSYSTTPFRWGIGSDCEFPEEVNSKISEDNPIPEEFQFVQSTEQAFYLINEIGDIEMGDIITAYCGENLVGSAIWSGAYTAIPVMGRDISEQTVGFCEQNEVPSFEWRKKIEEGKTELVGNIPGFTNLGVYIIDKLESVEKIILPTEWSLAPAYPNPFNPTTTIEIGVPEMVESLLVTTLQVFDINGRLLNTLIEGQLEPGFHTIEWDATGFPSGVYFVKMVAGDYQISQKLMLVK